MNLASIIESHPDDAPALLSRGRVTTYGELRSQVGALRGGLSSLGLGRGDRVAIAANNNWYFVVSYLATLGAGFVAVPLNPQEPAAELARQITEVGAAAVIVGPAARGRFDTLEPGDVPTLRAGIGAGFEPSRGTSLDELLSHDPVPVVECDPHDPAVLVFTSGTAGSPKAAVLTHRNLEVNLRQLEAAMPDAVQTADDVSLGLLPMFHIYGLNVVLGATLRNGSSVVLVERFDPVSALEAIQRHGITVVSGPPTMWAAFAGLTGVDPTSMASVRLGASGAAKLPAEVWVAIRDKYGLELIEGYGLTEASPAVTAALPGMPPGSVGVPVPGVEVRLVDEAGDDVLVGDSGEIWVRGPNVFPGYWDDEEATRRVLDEDGWLHTGDVAVVDDEGYIYVVDRMKDLIIVSGFNVFPAEVEEVLLEHPAIEACAVVGVPHPHTGEAVRAYVVVSDGRSIEEDDVVAFAASRLARYKCPNKVSFVEEIPRGLGGKVLRRELREAAEAS